MSHGPKGPRGTSLVSVLVAVAIAGLLAVAIATMSTRGLQSTKSAELKGDLGTIRRTLAENFDCARSLGLPTSASLPLACAAWGHVPVLDKNGHHLLSAADKLGVWSITARCVGDRVVFAATKPGNDPLTGLPWADSPSLRDPATGVADLFRGTSAFCANFFAPNVPPALYGGIIKKCLYDPADYTYPITAATAPIRRMDPATMIDPLGDAVNQFTGNESCPAGYTPHYAYGWDDWAATRAHYRQCQFWSADGHRWTPTDPMASANPGWPGPRWVGMSMAVFICSQP
jgi:hypothetical protein